MTATTTCLVGLFALALAPTPKDPPPDPMARGYLGIVVQDGTLVIKEVAPDTPAARAGLRTGDSIARVGTLQPRAFEEVVNQVCSYRPGTLLEVEVRRGDTPVVVRIRLAARPETLGPPPSAGPESPFPPDR